MKIYKGDSLDCLSQVQDRSVDLIVTDPPYAFGGSGQEHALTATVAVVLREAAEKLKVGGWMVVFAAASWRSQAYMVEALRGKLDPVRTATWVKPGATSKTRTPGWAWSSISLISFRRGKSAALDGSDLPDYIVEPALRGGRRAQLPDIVCDWAVRPYAVPGGLFLDPFAGSGALPFAAERAGMEAIGFEKDPPETLHGVTCDLDEDCLCPAGVAP